MLDICCGTGTIGLTMAKVCHTDISMPLIYLCCLVVFFNVCLIKPYSLRVQGHFDIYVLFL